MPLGTTRVDDMRWLAITLAALVVLTAGCGESTPEETSESKTTIREREVRRDFGAVMRYCVYGSQSKAQFHGCGTHVSPGEVLERALAPHPTNAALFGVGLLNRCLADAARECTLLYMENPHIRHLTHPPVRLPWLRGHTELVPIQIGTIHTAGISLVHSFSREQLKALGEILGKPVVNGGMVVLRPERFQALCATGYLRGSVCP
jgi:hypothetical protein